MPHPLVTIVTPSFNQRDFIRQTIDSVLQQDYQNIEYIVMDGGSTDGTLDILKTYSDPRLSWISEPDRGQSHAINKGLQRASGEFLTFINSDDLLLPGAVSFVTQFLSEHPEIDAIYGDTLLIDANGAEIKRVPQDAFDVKKLLVHNLGVTQQGCFWRREVGQKIGYLDENLHYTMDTDYWLRMALAGCTITHVSGYWSAYRLHEDAKGVSQLSASWREWDLMIAAQFQRQAVPAEIERMKLQTRAPHDKIYILQSMWDSQKDKKQIAKECIPIALAGHLPYKDRIIASALIVEGYSNIPVIRGLRFIYKNIRKMRD